MSDEKPEKSLHERFTETVDAWFGSLVIASVKDSLVDRLEQDVKDWLLSEVNKIV